MGENPIAKQTEQGGWEQQERLKVANFSKHPLLPFPPAVVKAVTDNLSHILIACQLAVKKKKRKSCLLIQLAGLFIRAGLAGAVRRPRDVRVELSLAGPAGKCRHAFLPCRTRSVAVFTLNAWGATRMPISCNEIWRWEDAQNRTKSSE